MTIFLAEFVFLHAVWFAFGCQSSLRKPKSQTTLCTSAVTYDICASIPSSSNATCRPVGHGKSSRYAVADGQTCGIWNDIRHTSAFRHAPVLRFDTFALRRLFSLVEFTSTTSNW